MSDGYGYEWDAQLTGGPADGCLDIVIKINGAEPPEFITKIVDGNEMKRETLGEKIIEYLTKKTLDGNQKVAVYKLREIIEDKCFYDYLETIKMNKYRLKYEEL